LNGFAMQVKDGTAREIPLEAALTADGALVWIHLHGEEPALRPWLEDTAGLPAYVVDPLVAVETRPRCTGLEDGAFVNLRGLSPEELATSDPLASVRLYAAAGRVYSVTRHKLTAMPAVRAEVEQAKIADPGDLIVAFAEEITDELDPLVADLGDTLDDCEEGLSADRVFELRRVVSRTRIQAIGYRRFLAPQRAALEKLAALPGEWLGPDDRLHIAAAADQAARMAEELEAIRERAALIHETLTDLRAEQIDQRSLQIAIVAMVFLPLTFLTGLLGMNVEGIPFAQEPWAFAGVIGVCIALAVGITAWFVHRHWLNR
jgi:zinc transporter